MDKQSPAEHIRSVVNRLEELNLSPNAASVRFEKKGYCWGNDRAKMDAVLEQHQDKNIIIIEKDGYKKIIGGELVW